VATVGRKGVQSFVFGDTVAQMAHIAAARVPTRTAIIGVDEGRSLTYAELDARSNRLAHALLGLGLAKSDRIGFWLRTSTYHIELYLAAAKAGLVAVPINERYIAREALNIIQDAGIKALVFDSVVAGYAESLGLSNDCLLIAAGDPVRGSMPLEELYQASSSAVTAQIAPQDLYMLGYTSGTTGKPKGAALTHGGVSRVALTNVVAHRLAMGGIGAYSAPMTFTATVPAFILAHFHVSGTVVLCSSREPGAVLSVARKYGCTYTHVPPSLVGDYATEIAASPESARSLISISQGAGKVSPHTLKSLNEAVSGRLILGWGMTENSGGLVSATSPLHMQQALEGDDSVLDSVGEPVPGARVVVVDDDGMPLPWDGESVGRLKISTGSLFSHYWKLPQATAAVLSGDWYDTGDMGFIEPSGIIHIRERRADLIVSGGMNVYPAEVEEVIREHLLVDDCVVVGLDDERWGTAVGAFVVPTHPAALTPEEIVDFCRARLASYKKPVVVGFGDAIPRTLSGKVQRFVVREMLQDQKRVRGSLPVEAAK
jgi:fatty-acyl-CoA synthase